MYSGKVSPAQCRANEDALAVAIYTTDKNPTRHSGENSSTLQQYFITMVKHHNIITVVLTNYYHCS